MFRAFTIWASLFMLLGSDVCAQTTTRKKSLSAASDSLTIDTLSIVPGSVKLNYPNGETVDSLSFHIDYANALLIWDKRPHSWPIDISYEVFPVLFTRKYSLRKSAEIKEEVIDNTRFSATRSGTSDNSLFSLEGLQKSGSISRSVGVGNNQDLSLNSNMTLQLAGKISEDLEIIAAISDDNIPIQPEGNTQQINDFDKVFVQLKRKSSTLTAGDLELRRPESYFMNFFKRTQGAAFSTAFKGNKNWHYQSSFSAAVAKGRSSRLSFTGIEGNQGPYRLTGSNGEQNIIVLSGTERVYVDGELLKRGQENEYVINYNTSELTFTARRLITGNSRIIVEFEYSDKNYARTLSYLNQQASNGKLAFRLNYYNEQDNRNQPFLQDLTSAQKQFLQSVGNNVSEALYPAIDTVSFSPDEILYKQIDTLGAQGVLVYSSDPRLAKFRPSFSYLGTGNGNYRLSTTSAANGRVFEFSPPVNGRKQGDYEPVSLLITPKKQQLVTLGTDYTLGKYTTFSSELALSNNDVNLFSGIGNDQNQGQAFRLTGKNERFLGRSDSSSARLITAVNYEWASSNFKALERYRSVEFERDFNLIGLRNPGAEHLGNFTVGIFKNPARNASYQFGTFIRQGVYQGFQNNLNGAYRLGPYDFFYSGSVLSSESELNKGRFIKQKADASRKLAFLKLGLSLEQESNETKLENGILNGSSFSFVHYKAYITSASNQGYVFRLEYGNRSDKLPVAGQLAQYSNANELKGEMVIDKNPNSILSISTAYRTIQSKDTLNQQGKTLLGRIDYNFNILKGFMKGTFFYDTGPGREPKREFSYLEVSTGQGVYTWNDYNSNGLKELNEFEIARYQDQARYIRISQVTNLFINTNLTSLNYTLRLIPALLLKRERDSGKFLTLFSTQTAFKTDRKTSGQKNFQSYNPFSNIAEEQLISENTFFRNTLFFNRNSPVFGFDINYQLSRNKTLLINGFDVRKREEGGLRLRWNIRKTNLAFEVRNSHRMYSSDLFQEKDFQIQSWEYLPELNYQFNNNFRMNLNGSYSRQNNQTNNLEQSSHYSLATEFRFNFLNKGTVNSGVQLVKNSFSGRAGSPIAYEMLEGLQPGNNMIWNGGVQKTLTQGIQLNARYEGRKSEDLKVIHTASLQFRAFF